MDAPRFLFYGPPGIGKSVLSFTCVECHELMPALCIDCEGRIRSVRSKVNEVTLEQAKSGEGCKLEGKVDVIRIRDWLTAIKALQELISGRIVGYKLLILENATGLNNACLAYVMRKDSKPLKLDEVYKPEWAQYRAVNLLFNTLLSELREHLPDMVVIMTAWPTERESETEDSSMAKIRPSLIGKLREEGCGLADLVGWLTVGAGGKRVLKFGFSNKVYAKFGEEGPEPPPIENPTMKKVMSLLGGP